MSVVKSLKLAHQDLKLVKEFIAVKNVLLNFKRKELDYRLSQDFLIISKKLKNVGNGQAIKQKADMEQSQ